MSGVIFRNKLTVIYFILFLTGSIVLGQDGLSGILLSAKRHSFEIGPEVYYFKYKETESIWGTDVKLMEEKGTFYGVTGAYTYHGWDTAANEKDPGDFSGWMFRAEGRYAVGKVDYDGATQGGEPLTISGIDDQTMELRPLVGLDFASADVIGTLYTGFGYRYLNDDSSDSGFGYERESNYYYLPIGITGNQRTDSGWFIGGTFEYDFLFRGLQKSYLSDVGLTDIENKQKSGYGLRASVRFEKKGEVNFIVEPFIRFWHIGKSETETIYIEGEPFGALEPENETIELGVNCIVRF